MEPVSILIMYAAVKFPIITTILLLMGMVRVVNKPLFAILHYLVLVTPWKQDDVYLDKVESSKAYKAFCFVLDWVTSIKLNPKK